MPEVAALGAGGGCIAAEASGAGCCAAGGDAGRCRFAGWWPCGSSAVPDVEGPLDAAPAHSCEQADRLSRKHSIPRHEHSAAFHLSHG